MAWLSAHLFPQRVSLDGEGVDLAFQLGRKRVVDQPVAVDPRLAGELGRHHEYAEMALARAGRALVARMHIRLVDHVEPGRPEAELAKSVESYLARMGMPKRLFQEIRQQPSEKVLLLDARRLKARGLDGTDPAYEQWLRANSSSPDAVAGRTRAFRLGLKETGYVEGENLAVEYRWADGEFGRMAALAAELARRQFVSTGGPPSALAARVATTTIPIVFVVAEDPVKLGLVASLARPGGNITGINSQSNKLVTKRLELLRQLVPGANRVAVLVNPASIQRDRSAGAER